MTNGLVKVAQRINPSATFWLWYHSITLVGWIIMVPITLTTSLRSSLTYLTGISVWALVEAKFAAVQGTRAEVKADDNGDSGGTASTLDSRERFTG